jgi:phosphatidate cytidylyltransferase
VAFGLFERELPKFGPTAIVIRMLRWRLLLSVLFIAGMAGLCWLDWHASRPGIVLLPLAIVAALLAAGELLAMLRKRGHDPLAWVVYGGVLITLLFAALPGLWPGPGVGWIAAGFAVSVLLAFVGELKRYDGSGRATTNLAISVFAIAYVGGLIGFLIQLRLVGGGSGRLGMLALVSMIAIVKSSDIGQYTAGRVFGKHKLAPVVSPGKTWEGVCGGVMFALVAGWLIMTYVAEAMLPGGWFLDMWIGRVALYAIALVAAGLIGDLAESLLKRDAGVKDSSSWMPGFGGVLDLLDSLMGAAPIAYLFWAMGWVGNWTC